nr:MAG TPA: IcmS, IcmW, IcmO (DotL) IV secretion system, Coupling.8A [Caudoviricetes sp.]
MVTKKFPQSTAMRLHERARGICEVMIPHAGCTGRAEHIHHRQLRKHGGRHSMENCVVICHRCHEWIHMHPAISYSHGWLVRSTDNPAFVRVQQGVTLLTERTPRDEP